MKTDPYKNVSGLDPDNAVKDMRPGKQSTGKENVGGTDRTKGIDSSSTHKKGMKGGY